MLNRSMYIFSSKMIGYAIRIALPIFLVRILSMADYGAYRQFFLLETVIAILFQLGINQSLFYFIPRDEEHHSSYFVNSMLMNLVVFGAAFAIITPMRSRLADALGLVPLVDFFPELVVYTFLIVLIAGADCYLCARQRILQSAGFEIGGQVVVSIATLTAAFATRSLDRIIFWMLVARAVHLIGLIAYIHLRLQGLRAHRLFYNIRGHVRYGVVLGLAGTAWTLQPYIHPIIVSRYLGVESFAVYANGITKLPVAHFYLHALAVVSLGQFAIMEKERDWSGIRRLWNEILTGLYGVVIPFVVLLVVLAKPLVLLMFTDRYIEAVPIFRIHTIASLAMLWNAHLILRAIGRNDVTLKVDGAVLVATPFVLKWCLDTGGMVGVITGQAVMMIGARLLSLYVLNRITGHPLSYVTTPGKVWDFYVQSWRKGLGKVREVRRRFKRKVTE